MVACGITLRKRTIHSLKCLLTNANVLLAQPVCHMDGDQREPVIITPAYDGLETNIPHPLMQFSDQDFPEGIPLFPKHDVVLAYLEKYAKNVEHLIHFSTQVVDISLQSSSQGKDTWQVKTVNLLSRLEMTENFDAVVVASGRAAVPHIPDVPGIADWNSTYPGSIMHSKSYRSRDTFRNKVSSAIRARQPP